MNQVLAKYFPDVNLANYLMASGIRRGNYDNT